MTPKEKITLVFTGDAAYNRSAYLEIVGNKVVFDNSDGEYGPNEFDLDLLINAIELHKKK
jgi:hypothetical protein